MPFSGCAPSAFHVRARYRTSLLAMLCMACVVCAFAPPCVAAPLDAEKALSSARKERRLEAVERLRLGRARVSEKSLKTAFQRESDPLLKVRVLQAMAAAEGPGLTAELAAALGREPDPMVRQAAAQELGKYAAQPGAVQALAAALAADKNPSVRYACALSLAHADTPQAVSALALAAEDSDPKLRRSTAFSLKRHKSAKARQVLKKLEKDADSSVRDTAGAR